MKQLETAKDFSHRNSFPLIGPPKQDRKQSIKNKNNRSLSFHFDLFSGCRFIGFSGFSLISQELLDETYIYAHHQNGLNEEIRIMCFICRFNVYFSRNQRKCSQNGEDENLKFEIYDISSCKMIYHLVGHEILNITVHFVFHFNVYFSRKCSQNLEKSRKMDI